MRIQRARTLTFLVSMVVIFLLLALGCFLIEDWAVGAVLLASAVLCVWRLRVQWPLTYWAQRKW